MGVNNYLFRLCEKHRDPAPGKRLLIAGYPDMLPDPEKAFSSLGYDHIDVIDIIKHNGCEILVDLNYPMAGGPPAVYDLVLDHGTCEHVFNIGQAAITLASHVKLGGRIIQHLPMNMPNHGFYAVYPIWYEALYSSRNGFEIEHFEGCHNHGLHPFHLADTGLYSTITDTLCTIVARKVKDVPVTFPQQQIYEL